MHFWFFPTGHTCISPRTDALVVNPHNSNFLNLSQPFNQLCDPEQEKINFRNNTGVMVEMQDTISSLRRELDEMRTLPEQQSSTQVIETH